MKQRITKIQLNEISDEQKEKLRDLWNPQYGDAYYYPKVDSTGNVPHGYMGWEIEDMKTHVLPLLSIGQMIELIQPSMIERDFNSWDVYHSETGTISKDELCDALWEATVKILKVV